MTITKYDETEVLISGAGPVGLTLACFLTMNGIKVKILDQKEGPVVESRALGVHARTIELLRPLGLDKAFIEMGRVTTTMKFHTPERTLFSLDFDVLKKHTPYPFYLILPQSTTEKLLVEWLEQHDVEIAWQSDLTEFEEHQQGFTSSVLRNGAREEIKSSYLIGCDGASSVVRNRLGIEFDGETYDASFMLSEMKIEEDKIETDATHVYLAKKTVAAVIPLPNGEYRVVGPNTLVNDGELSANFEDFKAFLSDNELLKNLTLTSPSRVKLYRMHKRVARSFNKGNVFLCGDAAHIHSPAGGQGMNTGMQDAINLAWKLTAVLRGQSSSHLLDSYDRERREISSRVVENTDKAMSWVTSNNPWVRSCLHYIAPLVFKYYTPGKTMQGMAQLTLDYSGKNKPSSISSITKGKRMPWFMLNDREDLFDLQNGKDWTILINEHEFYDTDTTELKGLLKQIREASAECCRAVILSQNKYYRPSESNFPDWVKSVPMEKGGPFVTANKPICAVLLRPDGYVQEIDSQVSLDKCLKAMTQYQVNGSL